MPKQFHSVGNAKKMLAYGAQKGMGPFSKRWPQRKSGTWPPMAPVTGEQATPHTDTPPNEKEA